MPSHNQTPTSRLLESHSFGDMQQKILSKWLVDQPAHAVTTSMLGKRNDDLSNDQIDAILATRKRIASAQKTHD